MSEEVKNEENNSKQKWLWLLLLLLLIIFVVIAIVVFLKDDGTAEATDNISDETSQEQVKNDDEPEEKTGISSNEKTQKLVVTAAETQLASAITTTEATSTPTEKTPVVVNVSDNSYFNEAVVLEITGEDFTATITDSNGNVSNYEGKSTLSEDGKYTLTIKDSDGTEKTVSFTIDTTNPSITGVENGKVYNTEVTPIIEELNIDKIVLTKDGNETEYNSGNAITEDGEYVLEVTDKAGNSASIAFIIDTTAPTYTIKYSTEKVTNKDVVVTITASEVIYGHTGWNKAGNDLTITKIFTKNSKEDVTFYDEAGNVVTVNVKIENIDKVAPTAKNIEYSTEKLTNGNVVVTITATEPLYGHPGWSKGNRAYKIKKTFTENGEETVILKDKAGNETPLTIKVVNIDKVAPTASTARSNNDGSTNKDVTVTITANESIKDIDGWTKIDDKTFTKVYSSNQKVTVEIEDLAGNKAKVSFEVKRIDKVPPAVTIVSPNKYQLEVNTPYVEKGYSAYDKVDKDVSKRVTKKYQFQAKGTGTWSFVNELDTSKLGTYKITYIFTDKAGNEAKGTRVVEIVDTTAPKITLNGEPVINFLERGVDTYIELGAISKDNYDEEKTIEKPSYINLYVLNDQGKYTFKGRVNSVDTNISGRYNLVYTTTDSSGNEAIKITRMVYVVDTIAPTATVTYSITALTNKDVVVTLEANENVTISNAGTWNPSSGYGTTFKKAYNKNMTQVVTLTDEAGNVNTVEVKIENIDKEAPIVTVESIVERVEDADGNWIDVKGGQKLIANEDVEIVNEPALVPVNGSAREYEITYSLFNPTHAGYHFINVIVRDKAGNETTADVEIFIPEYSTSNVSTTSTSSSTPLRMTKPAPKAAVAPTVSTPAVTEQEENNDKSDDLVSNDLITTENNKDDSNVIPSDSIVEDNKKEEQIIPTDSIAEDNKETTPVEPAVEDDKKDVQDIVQTETIVEDETPIQPVEEEPKTESISEPVIEEVVVTESEVLDSVVAE